MKFRTKALLILTTMAAAVLTVWLGHRVATDQDARVGRLYKSIAEASLSTDRERIVSLLDSIGNSLIPELRRIGSNLIQGTVTEDEARRFVSTATHVTGLLVQDAEGKIVYPGVKRTEEDFEFIGRVRKIVEERLLLDEVGPAAPGDGFTLAKGGWHPWFRNSGLGLLLWTRLSSGGVAMAEISMARLRADIICLESGVPDVNLPGEMKTPFMDMKTSILDSRDMLIVSRGGFSPPEGSQPFASILLSAPLSSWKATCHLPAGVIDAHMQNRRTWLFLLLGLALTGICCVSGFLYLEWSRELRDAMQKVNFVNQVSHELRTPLTNIRLHAELLEDSMDENDARGMERLGIIETECRRLTRMIDNILTFSRQQRNAVSVSPAQGVPDQIIESALRVFGPALRSRGIQTMVSLDAGQRVMIDRDALDQILGILIGNLLKYAWDGEFLGVVSGQADGFTEILLQDRGPGIPPESREEIFKPFARLKNSLTEGVSGAGIGLYIARHLAHLHGGDVKFGITGDATQIKAFDMKDEDFGKDPAGAAQKSHTGACFVIRLKTPNQEVPGGMRA